MTYKENALSAVIAAIEVFLNQKGVDSPVVVLDRPANPLHGHVSTNVGLRYGKELSVPPLVLAQELVQFLQEKSIVEIGSVNAVAPGFVNITLAPTYLSHAAHEIAEYFHAGKKETTLSGEKWVIEHTSPNPNKAMHLGHLRNNLTGMAISNVLEFQGAQVIRDAIDNNRGIAIAKAMYGFLAAQRKNEAPPIDVSYWVEHKDEWFTPEEKQILPDRFVTACYVAGEELSKSNADAESAVRAMVIAWENKDAATWELWSHVLSYSYAGIERTLARLGSKWDVVWHEHEHYEQGKKYVEEGLKTGIFKKLEDGAVLTDLAAYDLPDTILLKNDGTSLYMTQDIALTALKKEKYGARHLVWVIGPDQSLQMKQLFAICEQLNIGKRDEFMHVPYGYVGLADSDGSFKRMSSREGTVVLLDDVIDVAKEKIRAYFAEKEISVDEIERRSEVLALAAVKFAILRSQKDQQLSFDVDRSIDIHGDSGVYVLYTYARIMSLVRKAQEKGIEPSYGMHEKALPLASELFQYPTAIEKSANDFSPHHIAQQLLSVCSEFNSWYGSETILDGENIGTKISAAKDASIVIKNACSLLGISVLEEI